VHRDAARLEPLPGAREARRVDDVRSHAQRVGGARLGGIHAHDRGMAKRHNPGIAMSARQVGEGVEYLPKCHR